MTAETKGAREAAGLRVGLIELGEGIEPRRLDQACGSRRGGEGRGPQHSGEDPNPNPSPAALLLDDFADALAAYTRISARQNGTAAVAPRFARVHLEGGDRLPATLESPRRLRRCDLRRVLHNRGTGCRGNVMRGTARQQRGGERRDPPRKHSGERRNPPRHSHRHARRGERARRLRRARSCRASCICLPKRGAPLDRRRHRNRRSAAPPPDENTATRCVAPRCFRGRRLPSRRREARPLA